MSAGEYRTAIAWHQAGNLTAAAECYQRVLKLQPAHLETLQQFGYLRIQQRDYEAALPLLERAVELQPQAYAAWVLLATAQRERGALQLAIASYQQALRIRQDDAETWLELARCQFLNHDYPAVIAACNTAITLRPEDATAFVQRGTAAFALRDFEQALRDFDHALACSPSNVAALTNRGAVLREFERYPEALAEYDQALAIDPQQAVTWLNRGNVLRLLARYEEAKQSFTQALQLNPEEMDALAYRGAAAWELGDYAAAIADCEQVLLRNPDHFEAHLHRANALRGLNRREEALAAYEHAVRVRPTAAVAHANRAAVFWELGHYDEALSRCEIAIACDPKLAEAYSLRGNIFGEWNRSEEALRDYEHAIALAPAYAEAWSNRGSLLQELGQLEHALQSFAQSLRIDPKRSAARWSCSRIHLLRGYFQTGWDEYEIRWDSPELKNYRPALAAADWRGESLQGKTLVVYREQGIGDEIMFASCVPDLIAQGANVTLVNDARLVPVFERSFPQVRVLPKEILAQPEQLKQLPPFDFRVAAGSLPRFVRPSFAHFPERDRYLVADPEQVTYWKHRLEASPASLRIGIAWKGGAVRATRRARSTTLQHWTQLFALPGVQWINLQHGETADERAAAERELGVPIIDFPEINPLQNMDSFAALISALDLVISIDNSTVHLAGALGVPVWIALPFVPDWRWFLNRADSPWYRSARLFRQPTRGDWESVFCEMEHALRDRLCTRASS